MTRYVIVGCGAAGNSAAETIRKLDPDSEIRMFTREAAFYSSEAADTTLRPVLEIVFTPPPEPRWGQGAKP